MTAMSTAVHPLAPLLCKLLSMQEKAPGTGPTPTEMGSRIIALMTANNVSNRASFAEGVLGISRQRFHKWLYTTMRDVEAQPILRCADALSTNAEYLLGISDDPRPAFALEYREAQLLQAFRTMSETDQDRILQTASAWVGATITPATASAPFRHAPIYTVQKEKTSPKG